MLSSGLAGPPRARPSDAASDTSSVASGTQLAEGLPGGRMPLLDMLQQRLQRLQRRASRSGRLGYERLHAPGDEAQWLQLPPARAPGAPASGRRVVAPRLRGARAETRGALRSAVSRGALACARDSARGGAAPRVRVRVRGPGRAS